MPFDTAKEQIKKDLALDRAKKDLIDLQDKVEDERAGGATLKEIAPKFGLEAHGDRRHGCAGPRCGRPALQPTAAAETGPGGVLRRGRGRHGRDRRARFRADLVQCRRRDAGARPHARRGQGRRRRCLDRARRRRKRLQAKAEEMLKELNGGKSLDDVAKAASVEVKQAWGLKRNADAQGLSAAAINQVFATPVKGYATALSGVGR